jgi:hypothetical protein
LKRFTSLGVFFLWVSIAGALQLLLMSGASGPGVEGPALGRACVPDLMTLVLVVAVGRLDRRDVVTLALVTAAARAACTAAPPFAVLCGCLVAALAADTLRRFADLDRAWLRSCAAGSGALAIGTWLLVVDLVRGSQARATGGLSFGQASDGDFALVMLTAAVTALVAPLVWPGLHRLPGLRRLERKAF